MKTDFTTTSPLVDPQHLLNCGLDLATAKFDEVAKTAKIDDQFIKDELTLKSWLENTKKGLETAVGTVEHKPVRSVIENLFPGGNCITLIVDSIARAPDGQPQLDALDDCIYDDYCNALLQDRILTLVSFHEVHSQKDLLILNKQAVNPYFDLDRTWTYGPQPIAPSMLEPYKEGQGLGGGVGLGMSFQSVSYDGVREVLYFDKARMEVTDPSDDPSSEWFVTSGLLAEELITGRMQLGDNTFEQRDPAQVNVAGDLNDPSGPTYASFNKLLGYAAIPSGWIITQTVDRAGNVGADSSLSSYNVTAHDVGSPTHHNVASVFWDYMNSTGPVYRDGEISNARLFPNPFYATGYPLTEAYWTNVLVGGVQKQVLVQVFERRVLTYTPSNPDGWKVEAGNVGLQYYQWRYNATSSSSASGTTEIVAQGLNNPRGVAVADDGTIYVAEAGAGGSGTCVGGPEGGQNCFGMSGAITKIANGTQSKLAGNLPSLAAADGTSATGPAAVAVGNGRISVVVQSGTPDMLAALGGDAGLLGHLITIASDGIITDVADLSAYEFANNPSGDDVNSDPYAVLDLGDKWIVADAGANDLLQVTADGTITTLAIFPQQMVDAPPFLNMPSGSQMPAQSVPTSIALGSDGAYYVGELTGFPFPVGGARVWRVVPGQEPTVYASGFTNIDGLAFDANGNLLVLEIAKNGLLAAESAAPGDPAGAGALIRVLPDGTKVDVASLGLVMPGGVAVGPDGSIYITNFGVLPGAGTVVRLDY